MDDCLLVYGIATLLFIISIIFIIMTINLQSQVRSNNILNTYNIKKNDTVTRVIDIRKNDGTSCNISYIYEDGKDKETKRGSACK